MEDIQTKKDIIREACEDNNVRFIRLQFCDINGTIKNLSFPISQLNKVLNNEMMLDGSSIKGFRSIETSDMNMYPDLSIVKTSSSIVIFFGRGIRLKFIKTSGILDNCY